MAFGLDMIIMIMIMIVANAAVILPLFLPPGVVPGLELCPAKDEEHGVAKGVDPGGQQEHDPPVRDGLLEMKKQKKSQVQG